MLRLDMENIKIGLRIIYLLAVGVFIIISPVVVCQSSPSILASFVFGDSLVDAGNNNYLFTLSRANNLHNGVDFTASGGRPTGRFTNGRTIADIIGESLGLNTYAPPYLDPTTRGSAILKGVNYGSGGGGILNETGRAFINRLALDRQILYFENTRSELVDILGEENLNDYLSKSLFSVTIGANDYLNNYETPVRTSADSLLTPQEFQDRLLSRYREQLTRLYELGARKIIVVAIPPIGCTPYQRSLRFKFQGDCAERPNNLAINCNKSLKNMLIELNEQLYGSHFVYANVYDIVADLVNNYQDYGFQEAKRACCGTGGLYKGLIPCSARAKLCPDRTKYIFWDPYHTSEAANIVISNRLLDGDQDDVFPINVRQLAAL